ncbi:hypothetical protein B0J13DRAFT_557328 [Dactylonectria estremocensis]|uniref:Uncharacterized protein n=1 Tax=Dactylonectria estremocensis TaxID=1079267 RepID=A0A9P9EMH1_9HYPO|nr:hypothetical protein B0J13DRAFT_557328 [Dactylonectria estremocensis]
MATSNEFSFCTICGMMLETGFFEQRLNGVDDSDWLSNTTALSGPHWGYLEERPKAIRITDEAITRYVAVARCSTRTLQLLPSGRIVQPQNGYDLDEPYNYDPVAPQEWFFGIHAACEEIANRVMQTSRKTHIRSIGDLWMTLDRRCTKTFLKHSSATSNFLPFAPENQPGEPPRVGLGRYYIPSGCIYRLSNERDGWWDEDPLQIPDLTVSLLSGLEQVNPQNGNLQFRSHLASLPQGIWNEIKDLVLSSVLLGPTPVECNYLMPQSFWREVFLQIPFLWDLDQGIIDKKSLEAELEGNEWNWEKITRQIATPVKPPTYSEEEGEWIEWDYQDVGLVVPPGLNNRRRIWQIVEDMYPDDVDGLEDTWKEWEE